MKKILTKEQELKIIEQYNNGLSATKLAKEYNISKTTILNTLRSNNIKRRSLSECQKKYFVNESYFERIDSEDKAYFLGFLYADGCVRIRGKNSATMTLGLQEKDKEILESFKKVLNYSGPIKTYNVINYSFKNKKICRTQNQVKLQINSFKMVADLIKAGCLPKKTYCKDFCFPVFSQVPIHLFRHFIRGLFDGDGCIVSNKKLDFTFSLTGSKKICNSLASLFYQELHIKKTKLKDFNSYMVYRVGGNNNCRKIYDYLYTDSIFFMQRKKDKFKQILSLPFKAKSSKYKGVCFVQQKQLFKSFLFLEKKHKHIGYFSSEKEAKLALDKFCLEHNISNPNIF